MMKRTPRRARQRERLHHAPSGRVGLSGPGRAELALWWCFTVRRSGTFPARSSQPSQGAGDAHLHCILVLCVLALFTSRLDAVPPTDAVLRSQIIGDPIALDVAPKSIRLAEARAGQQILVTARYADGSVRDLTSLCEWDAGDSELIEVTKHGFVTGRADGATKLDIRVGDEGVSLPVTISNSKQPQPISFRREVMPVLSSAGCSDIRCHGAPSGKNGFRLSLWGSDPGLDYAQLTRDGSGRRTNAFAPSDSLIMLKALTHVSHAGGKRFNYGSHYANLLRGWQAEGLRDDGWSPAFRRSSVTEPAEAGTPTELRSLEVTPNRRVLHAPARWQQLAVRATFADGRTADVTHLTTFQSTDLAVASVNRTGLVEFNYQGEVAILCRFLGKMESARLMHIASPSDDYRWSEPPVNNFVDQHVFAKLKMLHINPSDLCSDEQFVRRIYLDLCGVLPPPVESQAFVASTDADKRAKLIDQLLQRPEYADYWTKKWMDVLRVSRDSINLAGAKVYQAWLRDKIEKDTSFADVAQALLTSQGESYKDAPANFYCVPRDPEKVKDPYYLQKDLAEATAQLFLGVRLQCAQCHNHPYERWTQDDYLGLAAFFTQIKRTRLGKAGPGGRPERRQISITLDAKAAEIKRESNGEQVVPGLLGEAAPVVADQDRRKLLADWLTKQDNPFFAKAVVNRVWFHMHGRGIVEPVDDFRDSNPSANDALLNSLAADFVASGFKLRPLIRSVANSRTYQLTAAANESNRSDARYFSHMMARPLPAEVLLDAICEVTAVSESFEITADYTIGVPEGTVKMPAGTRAVQLPVTDIVTLINTSGKYVRYELHPFLRTFGQPSRTQTCECDRESNFNRKQALELIVGSMVTKKLADADNRIGKLLANERTDADILDELYRRALSRPPSESTSKAFLAHIASSEDKRQAWEDILWAVLNSQEFIYQH